MLMKAEKLYQCEFCGKGGFNRKKMRHHEENCPLNPSSKSCQTCAYLFQELFKINPEHTMLSSASDIFGRRPMCKAGISISTIEKSRCKLNLTGWMISPRSSVVCRLLLGAPSSNCRDRRK